MALSEPAGTAQEVVASSRCELVYQRGLVYIDVTVSSQFLEVLYSNRVYHSYMFFVLNC